MSEQEIREMAGVRGHDNQWVQVEERDERVVVVASVSGVRLTVAAARRLARQINRLARRLAERQAAGGP